MHFTRLERSLFSVQMKNFTDIVSYGNIDLLYAVMSEKNFGLNMQYKMMES